MIVTMMDISVLMTSFEFKKLPKNVLYFIKTVKS